MNIWERLAEGLHNIIVAAVLAIGGGIAWLVRRVMTNQEEIALLKQHLDARDQQRDEDREALSEVKSDVKDIRNWLMQERK